MNSHDWCLNNVKALGKAGNPAKILLKNLLKVSESSRNMNILFNSKND